jgi:hypothetical protein
MSGFVGFVQYRLWSIYRNEIIPMKRGKKGPRIFAIYPFIRELLLYTAFFGHEILFYGGEILLGQPVKKHLFKSVCTYSQEIPRGGDVTFGAQKSRIRELRRRCEMNLRQF